MVYSVNRHSSDGHGTPSRTTIHRDCAQAEKHRHSPKWEHFQTLKEAIGWGDRSTPYRLNFCGNCKWTPAERAEFDIWRNGR